MITANTHMTSPDTASGVSSPVKAPKKAAPAFDMNSLFSEENILKIVYSKIIGKNKNVFGLDFVSAASFVRNLRNEIDIIRRKTADGSYSFTRYRLQLISKGPDKKPRKICIPTVRDRIVIALLSEYLKHAFPDETRPLMPNLVINRFIRKKNSHTRFFKLDITTFFGTINHKILFRKLQEKIHDRMVLDLFQKLVTTDSYDPESKKSDRSRAKQEFGIPEGLSCSGLLAEIFLSDFDRKYSAYPGITFFRYVDDILVLCEPDSFQKVKDAIDRDMNALKLEINHEKDEDGDLSGHLQYLGYVFDGKQITVRKSSVLKHEEALEKMFRKYADLLADPKMSASARCSLSFEFQTKISLLCAGVKVDEKQLGWLSYYRKINDTKLLHHFDWLVGHFFKRFNTEKFPVKRHVRAYYELNKNIRHSTYIHKIDSMKIRSFTLTDEVSKLHKGFDKALSEINDGRNRNAVVSFILSHPGKFPELVLELFYGSSESAGSNRNASENAAAPESTKGTSSTKGEDSGIVPESTGTSKPETVCATSETAGDEEALTAPEKSTGTSETDSETPVTNARTCNAADRNDVPDTDAVSDSNSDDAETSSEPSSEGSPEIQKILERFERGGEITARDYLLLTKKTDIDLVVKELVGTESEVSREQIDTIASNLVIGEMIEDPIIREDFEEAGYY